MAWPACIACEWWSDSGAMFGDSALLVYRVTELRETERDGVEERWRKKDRERERERVVT